MLPAPSSKRSPPVNFWHQPLKREIYKKKLEESDQTSGYDKHNERSRSLVNNGELPIS